MSYPFDIDTVSDEELGYELQRRQAARARGKCDYCHKDLGSTPPCAKANRHVLPPPQPDPSRGRWTEHVFPADGGRKLRFFEYTDQKANRGIGVVGPTGRRGLWLYADTDVVLDGAPLNVFTGDHQRAVAAFMVAMSQGHAESPRVIDPVAEEKLLGLRIELVREEFEELVRAATGVNLNVFVQVPLKGPEKTPRATPDLVQTADAFADLLYVLYGWACAAGIDLDPIFKTVHRANMAKAGGPKREDGKRLKPPGWQPPDVAGELRAQGWRPEA